MTGPRGHFGVEGDAARRLDDVFSRLRGYSGGSLRTGIFLLQLKTPAGRPPSPALGFSAALRPILLAGGLWSALTLWPVIGATLLPFPPLPLPFDPSSFFPFLFLFLLAVSVAAGSMAYLGWDFLLLRWLAARRRGRAPWLAWLACSTLLLPLQGVLLGFPPVYLLSWTMGLWGGTQPAPALPLIQELALALSIGLILPGQIYLSMLSSRVFLRLKLPEVADADRKVAIALNHLLGLQRRKAGSARGRRMEEGIPPPLPLPSLSVSVSAVSRYVYRLVRRELVLVFLGEAILLTCLFLAAFPRLAPWILIPDLAGAAVMLVCTLLLLGFLLWVRVAVMREGQPRPAGLAVDLAKLLFPLATAAVLFASRNPAVYPLFLAIGTLGFTAFLRSLKGATAKHPEILPYRHLQAILTLSPPEEQLRLLENIARTVEKLYQPQEGEGGEKGRGGRRRQKEGVTMRRSSNTSQDE